jgi:6-phosphofructokinase 1
MGRDSGYIAIESGIGGGAELIMVPETSTTVEDVIHNLSQGRNQEKTSSIVVVAEGDEEGGAMEVVEKVRAKLKGKDLKVSILGHIQRGGSPTAMDRILGSRLGLAALEGLLSGKKNMMAGVVNNRVVFTDFKECINTSKPLDQELLRMVRILSI